MAIPREPVLSPTQALQTALDHMKNQPARGILRAFTLRVNPRPDADDLLQLNGLALEHGFELLEERAVYGEGPDKSVVFLYSVVPFRNLAPVTQ